MSIKVFIFEDHWMCREALVSVLSKVDGIEVVGAAEEVQEGLDHALKIKPDVVLMDIRFKIKDSDRQENLGIKATSVLTKKLPETKVIVFTEFPDEDNLHSAVKAGASGYLLKTEVQDSDIIVQAINSVHRGEAYMTPSMTAKILKVVKKLSKDCKYDLTKREIEIVRLIAEGKDNREIAKTLNVNVRTIANHVSNILLKMHAKNRTEAAAIARKDGVI